MPVNQQNKQARSATKMPEIRLPKIQRLASISNLAIALKASAIGVAVAALFYQDLSIIFNDALRDEATSHILVIPFIFAYLIYRKRKMLRAVIPFERADQPKQTKHLAAVSGILLSATAIILYWYGSFTFTPLEYHILTLPIFAAGLLLILFNPQTLRQLAFPIAFLIFLTPPPSEILYSLGSTLSVIGSEASNAIVSLLGIPSKISGEYGNPTIIITRPDQTTIGFTVDIACSGIYSLIGFLIFAAFIAYIARDKLWKKAAIFLLGLPLIYLLNIIRITIILLIGYQFGEELALQVFHLIGGWILIFLGTLLLLTISEKAFKTQIFTKTLPPAPCPECNPNPSNPTKNFCSNCGRLLKYPQTKLRRNDLAKIATIAAVMILLLSIQAPVFALTKGPAQIIIQTPTGEQGNTQILPQIPEYTLQFIYRDKNFEQIAKQNASLIYAYSKTDTPTVWVGIEIAETTSSLHRWETCLITWPQTHGYQPKVQQLDLRDVQILQNPPVIARYFAFKYTNYNETQVVLYWFETSVFTINNASSTKQVEISLVMHPDSSQDVSASEEKLLPFAIAIANYWQPIKTWTQVALILSKNGLDLAAATTVLLAFAVIFQVYENRKERNRNAKTYQKLSLTDKTIIDAVYQTKKNTTPTLQNIAATLRKTTSTPIKQEALEIKLAQSEKTGLISNQIANRQDEPVKTWKTNLSKPLPIKEKLRTLSNFLHRSKPPS